MTGKVARKVRADLRAVFVELGDYLTDERPEEASAEQLFVVLKRPRRGGSLSADGLDEIVENACRRAGLRKLTCHQPRHTCFTRLREAGMQLEAIQAQAGHVCIESTRVYRHLSNDWLAEQYDAAMNTIDAEIYDPAGGGGRRCSAWPPQTDVG